MATMATVTPKQTQWLQQLQSFLNVLLTPITKDQAERNLFIGAKAMPIWAAAFTHETYAPAPEDNYEDLEYEGDAILKAVFPKYLRRRFPYLHKGEYTELNAAYMSKIMQAQLARQMGLSQYIRVTGIDRAILNLETDVFESFFGALETVADSISDGLGYAKCYNMIVHIFKDIEIDESKGRGSAKTQVQQMFSRFDLNKPRETIDDRDIHNIKFTVTLEHQHVDFLRSYGVDIRNPNIGYGQAPTKKEAEFEAYTQALKLLASYGIDTRWAEEAKNIRDFSEPSVMKYVQQASERLRRDGFATMYFFIPRKTVTAKGAIVQLVGVRDNGQNEVLSYTYTSDREDGYRAAKSLVIQQYVLHGQKPRD